MAKLRLRLLDLTARNPLLNFRHTSKGGRLVRVIDELPDALFSRLDDDQAFRFKSFAEAHQQAHKEHGESVVALFDLGAEQLLIAQLSDETAEQSFAVHY